MDFKKIINTTKQYLNEISKSKPKVYIKFKDKIILETILYFLLNISNKYNNENELDRDSLFSLLFLLEKYINKLYNRSIVNDFIIEDSKVTSKYIENVLNINLNNYAINYHFPVVRYSDGTYRGTMTFLKGKARYLSLPILFINNIEYIITRFSELSSNDLFKQVLNYEELFKDVQSKYIPEAPHTNEYLYFKLNDYKPDYVLLSIYRNTDHKEYFKVFKNYIVECDNNTFIDCGNIDILNEEEFERTLHDTTVIIKKIDKEMFSKILPTLAASKLIPYGIKSKAIHNIMIKRKKL